MNKEYNLKLEDARKIEGFKISYSMDLKGIGKLFRECKEQGWSDLLSNNNCLVCMELLNASIELTYYDVEEYGLDYGFFCCTKSKKYGWGSGDFTDLEIYDGIFDNKDKFEELMFNSMMEYISKNYLYWSKAN